MMRVRYAIPKMVLGAAAVVLPVAFFQANAKAEDPDPSCADYCCSTSAYCAEMYYDAPWCRTPASLGGNEQACCATYHGYCCMNQLGSCLC
jgi:hypothetical protein